jgi:hypothetical protein
VEVESFDQFQDTILVRRIAETNPEPFGLWLTDFLVIADYA